MVVVIVPNPPPDAGIYGYIYVYIEERFSKQQNIAEYDSHLASSFEFYFCEAHYMSEGVRGR